MSKKTNGKTYYSFDEIGQELYDLKPYKKVTRDKQKLAAQREKFLGTCPHCKKPLKYVYATNIVICDNDECDKSFFRMLSDKSLIIGTTIFEEKEEKI